MDIRRTVPVLDLCSPKLSLKHVPGSRADCSASAGIKS